MKNPSLLPDLKENIGEIFRNHHQKIYRSFALFSYRFGEKYKNITTKDIILQRPRSTGKKPTKKQLRLQDRVLNVDEFIVVQFKKFLVTKVKHKNYKDIDDNMMKVFWDLKRGEELERKLYLDNTSIEMNREVEKLRRRGVEIRKKRLSQQGDKYKTPFSMRMSIYAGVKMFRLSILEPSNLMKRDSNIKRALTKMRIATKFLFHGRRAGINRGTCKEGSTELQDNTTGRSKSMKLKSKASNSKRSKGKLSNRKDLRCYFSCNSRFLDQMNIFKTIGDSKAFLKGIQSNSRSNWNSKSSFFSVDRRKKLPSLRNSGILHSKSKIKGRLNEQKKVIKFAPYKKKNNFRIDFKKSKKRRSCPRKSNVIKKIGLMSKYE